MNYPTDPVAAMREAASDILSLAAENNVTNLMAAFNIPDKAADGVESLLLLLAAHIRALPIPEPPLVIDDPLTESQKHQLDEALHFQNALVDLLGEPTEKLEPWALAKIKAMHDALATTPRRSGDEIREEIARLTGLIDEARYGGGTHFAMLARREAMEWVLNGQEGAKPSPSSLPSLTS